MATEAELDHLFVKLVELMGLDAATTLMFLLRIPGGWRPPQLVAQRSSN